MHSDQFPYRQLVEALWECEGRAYAEVLVPWLARYPSERDWLEGFAARSGAPVPPATVEDLWRLYALGRVVETLLLRFQPGQAEHDSWEGPNLDLDELRDFAQALGLQAGEAPDFSPFDHEVVTVDPVEGQGVLEVVTHLWPRLTLGPLMIARGGVRVRASADVMRKDVAEGSKLWWAYRRRLRPVEDLSHGWGHNSQWRTSFRRDYRFGSMLMFNVDEALDLGAPEPPSDPYMKEILESYPLSRDERIELLVNRCFVRTTPPDHELWPYDDTLVIDEAVTRRDGATWRLGPWP